MDAKEAIKCLENHDTSGFEKWLEAKHMAFEALEKVETLEAENAMLRENADKWTDLISKAGAVGLNETDFFKSALICKMNEENKILRKLAFDRCPLHGQAFGNTENCQDMPVNGKCEGYCRSNNDDEPLDDRIKHIADHYGLDLQLIQCASELIELGVEELKMRLAKEANDINKQLALLPSIVDEITDVEIMCEQLKHLFHCKTAVENRKEYKINRQLERMGKENGKL